MQHETDAIAPPAGTVSLAPLSVDCASAMHAWMRDPEVADNLGLSREATLASTIAWIDAALKNPTIAAFAIHVGGTHVGNVVLDQIDARIEAARFSIYIGEGCARRRGFGRAAIFLALEHAFCVRALNKVYLTVHSENIRAIGLYYAVGFALEGVLRDEFRLGDRLIPALRMAFLRADYLRRRTQWSLE